jgi:hypothetical protein
VKKPSPTKYSEQHAKARFDQALNDALSTPRKPLAITATMKRRALKKPGKPKKKAGKGGTVPAV